MEKWIVLGIGGIELVVTIVGLIIVAAKNRGYTDRRLEDYDKQANLFWRHVNNRAIHEESMDAKLIENKFELVNNKIDNVARKVADVDTEMKLIRTSVHDLRNTMPAILAKALETFGRGKNA